MYTNNIYENLKKALYNNQITTEEAPVLKKICKLIERMAGIHSAVRVEPLDGYINVFKDYVVEVRETTNTKNALKSFDNKYIFRDYVTIANLNAAKVAELLEKAFDEEDSELLTSLMYKVKKETERLNDDRETAIEREKVQYNIPQIYKEQAKKILELFYDKSELEEIHLNLRKKK